MDKRVRITNEKLNSYKTWVSTAGMDIEQYSRNPVLLYMHNRGQVIGLVKNLKVEGDELTGELAFDEATDLSKQCKKQWEFGSLRMVSAGIDIMETSDEAKLLKEGQAYPTITKSKLTEVSLVDIGANDDAIVLMKEGNKITLGKDGDNPLPLLKTSNNKSKQKQMEELKNIALKLGLPETATEADILAKIEKDRKASETAKAELAKAEERIETLNGEKDTLELASITQLVDQAIAEKKIGANAKEQFVALGKKVGTSDLKSTLEAMSPQVKATTILGHQGSAPATGEYKKFSEVPEATLKAMRENDAERYKALFKAEYGFEPKIEE